MRRALLLLTLASCQFTLDRALDPGDLRGTVIVRGTGGAFAPVKGARVALAGGLSAKSDADGRFVLRRVPAGRHSVKITADLDGAPGIDAGLVLRDVVVESDGGLAAVDLGRLTIGAFGAIDGDVTFDPALKGPARAVSTILGEASISAEGTFAYRNVLPGEHEVALFVHAPDGAVTVAPQRVVVGPAATAKVHFDVLPGATLSKGQISGLARLLGETSAADIALQLVPARGSLPVVTDARGAYSWVDLPIDSYTIVATKTGFLPASLPYVVPGDDLQLPDLVLVPGTGGCDGEPFTGADADGDGTSDADEAAACRCDPDGRADANTDGVCDHDSADRDGDGFPDATDACPDEKGDARGLGCELDHDHDGVDDTTDNCPLVANPGQENGDTDPAGNACDPTLIVTSPATEFTVESAYLTISGTCIPSLTASLEVPNSMELVSYSCDAEGVLDVEFRFTASASTYFLALAQQKPNGSLVRRAFVGTFAGHFAFVGTPGGFATLDEALAGAASGDILSLEPGTYRPSGPLAITFPLTIEGPGADLVTISPLVDLPNNTDPTSAWFHVKEGGSLRLRGVTLDASGKVVRAGAVRGPGRIELEDCVLRNVRATDGLGTAVWIEGPALVRRTRFENIEANGLVVMGATADALVEACTYVGKGTGNHVDYFVDLSEGAHLDLRTSTATALLGKTNLRTSLGVSIIDANATLTGNVFPPVVAGGGVIVVDSSTAVGRTIELHENAFPGDWAQAYGVANSSTAVTVKAERNWWGHVSGPRLSSGGATGSGAIVTEGVSYTPFLTDGKDADPIAPGFQVP